MKRILTFLAIATFASCSIFAQDDMYFTPKSKAEKEKEKAAARAEEEKKLAEQRAAEAKRVAKLDSISLEAKKEWFRKNRHRISQTEDGKLVYHRGRDCSDDEYNHRGKFASTYTVVSDSTASDIIEFTPGDGQYPDSLIASIDTTGVTIKKKSTDRYDDEDDYYYSRCMNRFDGFYGSSRYWLLYNNPWYSHWAYDPFFWNDPWYYGNYGAYFGGYYAGYRTTYYVPVHRHHHHTPVAIGSGVGTHHPHNGGGRIYRNNGSGYRGFTSDIRTSARQQDYGFSNHSGSSSDRRGRFGGSRSSQTYINDGSRGSSRSYSDSGSSSSSNRGRFGGSRSNSNYSNSSSSSSSSRSYSSPSSSSSSSRSYSSPSSSSSSSGSRGSFGGSRGGGGGGGSFGGSRSGSR